MKMSEDALGRERCLTYDLYRPPMTPRAAAAAASAIRWIVIAAVRNGNEWALIVVFPSPCKEQKIPMRYVSHLTPHPHSALFCCLSHQPTPIQHALARLPQCPSLPVQAPARYLAVHADILDQLVHPGVVLLLPDEPRDQ